MPDQIKSTAATTLAMNQPTRRPEMIMASPALATATSVKAAAEAISARGNVHGQTTSGDLAHDAAGDDAGKGEESQLFDGRAVQRGVAIDRGLELVGDDRRFEHSGPPRPPERHPMPIPRRRRGPTNPAPRIAKSRASARVKRLSGDDRGQTKKIPEKSAAKYTR